MTDILDELLPPETEGITKEQDEEIMKAKQRQVDQDTDIMNCVILSKHLQMFLDDVGVTIAMITVTLLAVCVVFLKVLIFSDKVWKM